MRVANVDGLVTLFYDGSDIYNEELLSEWSESGCPSGEALQSNEDISTDCKKYMTELQLSKFTLYLYEKNIFLHNFNLT